MKKFKRSPITIVCYVIAALLCVYFITVCVATVRQINEYYASYGMTAQFGEIVTYILQQGLTPLVSSLLMFMAAVIHDEVRKLNPANWVAADEVKAAKAGKAAADDGEIEFVNEEAGDKTVEVAADDEQSEAGFTAEAAETAEEVASDVEEAAEAAEEAVNEAAETAEDTAEAAKEAAEEAAADAAEIVGEATEDIEHTIVMDANDVAAALKASYDAAKEE